VRNPRPTKPGGQRAASRRLRTLVLNPPFVLALGTLKAEPRITAAFRTGAGMGWHEHDEGVFTGCEQFFRPGSASRSPLRPISPAPPTIWPPRSTACTTWATRSPRPGTSARPSSRTAPGWSSSPTRALGAQAGEAAIRQVTADAGFTRFRRAAETPFNIVYEVRP
jgi:hypothetical protein